MSSVLPDLCYLSPGPCCDPQSFFCPRSLVYLFLISIPPLDTPLFPSPSLPFFPLPISSQVPLPIPIPKASLLQSGCDLIEASPAHLLAGYLSVDLSLLVTACSPLRDCRSTSFWNRLCCALLVIACGSCHWVETAHYDLGKAGTQESGVSSLTQSSQVGKERCLVSAPQEKPLALCV